MPGYGEQMRAIRQAAPAGWNTGVDPASVLSLPPVSSCRPHTRLMKSAQLGLLVGARCRPNPRLHACSPQLHCRPCSLRYVPTAVLSRQTAGLRGKSLIINLPGKPKSIRETIDEVRPVAR